jgi:hypothetical protein
VLALVERRKPQGLARAPVAAGGGDRLDAGEALGRVALEARLRLLAVAHDVEAELDLLGNDRGHRLLRAPRQHLGGIGLAGHLRPHQRGQVVGARQAAGVRGQDAFAAFIVEAGHAFLSTRTPFSLPLPSRERSAAAAAG